MSRVNNIIEIAHLTKTYGRHRGIDNISFAVEEGDMFAFLGPNGAGKSTTIRSMLGLIGFDSGSIRILGKDVKKDKSAVLKEIGYMPSEAMFYPNMKVKEVIRLAADLRKTDCRKEAERLCESLQMDTGKRIRELSLGNRKKVSIVCALQHKPRLLLLDEPTSGLDPLMQDAFFHLLQEANRQGTTCFLSSHILSEVKKYCRNAAIIKNGKILKTDTVENLSKSNLRLVKVWKNGKEESFSYCGSMRELIHRLDGMEAEDVLIEEPSLEEEGHTAEFLYTLPVSRSYILIWKYVAMLALILIFNGICMGFELVGFMGRWKEILWQEYFLYHVATLIMQILCRTWHF